MNEKQEKFESDMKRAQARTELNPPAEMFIGPMKCFLCGAETIGLSLVSSGWRCIEAEGKKYFLCKKDLPSVVASVASWQAFYVRVIRKIWEKDFQKPIQNITIYVDRAAPQKVPVDRTPAGTVQIHKVEGIVGGSVEDIMKDMFERNLPTILAAIEYIPEQNGTPEFATTADCEIKELDYTIHLKIDFVSFGGVRLEHLPEKEKKIAELYLPLFLTLEKCRDMAIELAFNEMERQNGENMRQAFKANVDQLTFIEGFLYKVILEYKFQFKDQPAEENIEEERIFVAPKNPNLN